jgi:hypothetical protein
VAEQPERLAAGNLEGEPVDRPDRAERSNEPLDAKRRPDRARAVYG